MAQVTMEIIEPYVRQGNDVIVTIRKTTDSTGMPSKIESLFLRLRNLSNIPDDKIRQIAMSKIAGHLEKMPED